jgi:hypothetical protein
MRETMIQPVYARRLHELEQTFAALEPQIHDSPEKQAFSLLHGMVQELWRGMQTNGVPNLGGGLTIDDIANMYKQAPKMDGMAQNAPLPLGTRAPNFALPDPNGQLVRLVGQAADRPAPARLRYRGGRRGLHNPRVAARH